MVKYDRTLITFLKKSARAEKVRELIIKLQKALEKHPTNNIREFYKEILLSEDCIDPIDYFFDENVTRIFSLFNLLLLKQIPDLLEKLDKLYFGFFYSTPVLVIDIPKNIRYIEEHAFYNCEALKEINYAGTFKEWEQLCKVSEGLNGAEWDMIRPNISIKEKVIINCSDKTNIYNISN